MQVHASSPICLRVRQPERVPVIPSPRRRRHGVAWLASGLPPIWRVRFSGSKDAGRGRDPEVLEQACAFSAQRLLRDPIGETVAVERGITLYRYSIKAPRDGHSRPPARRSSSKGTKIPA
jgi:hypothetical protein